jgi:hypothetical protein
MDCAIKALYRVEEPLIWHSTLLVPLPMSCGRYSVLHAYRLLYRRVELRDRHILQLARRLL